MVLFVVGEVLLETPRLRGVFPNIGQDEFDVTEKVINSVFFLFKLSVMVRVTLYIPVSEYWWEPDTPVPVEPSPKSHS
jgi:hypothetical protein